MRKLLLLLSVFALFAIGKMSAATGDVITGYVTHIDPSGNRHSVEMLFQISDQTNKFVRIYGYKNEEGFYSSLSLYAGFYEGEIIVPEKIGDYTVRSVGNFAFSYVKGKVTLPESVTEIEDKAFYYYAYDGYDFALPARVTYIGIGSFSYAKIKGISLPSKLRNIGDNAFSGSSIEELVIPQSVYVIGGNIGGTKMNRLEVESGCENYTTPAGSNVIMETRLHTIIAGCKNSKIPDEARRIAPSAFLGVEFTNTTLTLPENIAFVGYSAFYDSNIKRLIIKGETVDIQKWAFIRCKSLERIDIYGDNVTIGESAFEGCTGLVNMYCRGHKPKLTWYEDVPANRQFYNIGPDWEFGNSKVLLYARYPDEYTEKFLTGNLVWQNWFKAVLPLPATQTISEIRLTDYDWPVAESNGDRTATSLTEGATVKEITYVMFHKTYDPSPAKYNETFSIAFTITLEDDYKFGDNPKLYVDDRAADMIVDGSSEKELRFVFTEYTVPAPPGGVPIKTAYVSVPEPVEGQMLSAEVISPTGRKYNLLGYVIDTVAWAPGLEVYDLDKNYALTAVLTAKENYCFASDCTFTLNGKDASVIRFRSPDGRERVILAVPYGIDAPVEPDPCITSVAIEVPLPEKGKPLSNEILRPTAGQMKASGYTISCEWLSGRTIMTGRPYDPTANYELTCWVTAAEGCTFVPGNSFTLNGRQADCEFKNGKKALIMTVNYGGEAPEPDDTIFIKQVKIYVNVPVEGEIPSDDILYPSREEAATLGYEIFFNAWFPGQTPFASDSEFEYDVFLKNLEGYAFSPDVEVYVNGRKGEIRAVLDTGISAAVSFSTHKKGDVNHDGDVNSADVVAIYAYIIEGDASGYTKEAADVDGSGDVNSADVVAVYDIIINGDKE
jgi:hypothetical protein